MAPCNIYGLFWCFGETWVCLLNLEYYLLVKFRSFGGIKWGQLLWLCALYAALYCLIEFSIYIYIYWDKNPYPLPCFEIYLFLMLLFGVFPVASSMEFPCQLSPYNTLFCLIRHIQNSEPSQAFPSPYEIRDSLILESYFVTNLLIAKAY